MTSRVVAGTVGGMGLRSALRTQLRQLMVVANRGNPLDARELLGDDPHARLRRWGIDTSEFDVMVEFTAGPGHAYCSHGLGNRRVSDLGLVSSAAKCPDLQRAGIDGARLRDLAGIHAYLEVFENTGMTNPAVVVDVLSGEPRAAGLVYAAARRELSARVDTLAEMLTRQLGDDPLPHTRPSTYLYQEGGNPYLAFLLGIRYERVTDVLAVVPHRVAHRAAQLSSMAITYHHDKRLAGDTEDMLETALRLCDDGMAFPEALACARALEGHTDPA